MDIASFQPDMDKPMDIRGHHMDGWHFFLAGSGERFSRLYHDKQALQDAMTIYGREHLLYIAELWEYLGKNRETRIVVTSSPDVICRRCRRSGDASCIDIPSDGFYMDLYGFKEGSEYTAGEAIRHFSALR